MPNDPNLLPAFDTDVVQSKRELRAKALSRLSRVDYRHILRGRLRTDDENWPRVLEAATAYAQLARHLTVVEGDERMTLDAIRNLAIRRKAAADADRCLVVVDYLQIIPLQENDIKRVASAKDKVDLHVSGLRRVARELDSPVLAISSENRASYAKARSMDVFKESGIIEYSADIAAILTRGDEEDSTNSEGRVEDLNIVKNRNGECGRVTFRFYARRAEFVETGLGELPGEE